MATYDEIHGKRIKELSADPTLNSSYEGQVWYNSTDGYYEVGIVTIVGGDGFDGGFAGLVAAQDNAFELDEHGDGAFTTGNKLVAVVEDATNTQIEVGIVTMTTAANTTKSTITAAEKIFEIDITNNLTVAEVAGAIDLIGIAS